MPRLICVLVSALQLFVFSAAAQQGLRNNPSSTYDLIPAPSTRGSVDRTKPLKKATVTHQYEVKAIGVKGNPLEGVAITMDLTSNTSPPRQATCVTDVSGSCPTEMYKVSDEGGHSSVVLHLSSIDARATKEGFYPASNKGYSSRGSSLQEGHVDLTLVLARSSDFLSEDLRNSVVTRDLRIRAEKFADMMRTGIALGNASLPADSVGTSEFKGKKYVRAEVNVHWLFNTELGSEYLHGQVIFDRAARKILVPLQSTIGMPAGFSGYDVSIRGSARSFDHLSVIPVVRVFRFLMPFDAVRKYRGSDISGQTLLNSSIILLDDERIELTLK